MTLLHGNNSDNLTNTDINGFEILRISSRQQNTVTRECTEKLIELSCAII